MRNTHIPPRSAQRGAAALAVAMILLFGMTMVAFYANRGLLFEQRTSANQYRATSAFEVAEAGIEWAAARLNEPKRIDTACAASASAGDPTFRDKYVPYSSLAPVGFAPGVTRTGCRLPATGAWVCSCPNTGGTPNLGAANEPSFTVQFAPVPGDAESVEIRADGCTGQGTQCVPASTLGASDAWAQVRVVHKFLPALRTIPQSALTAGGSATFGGTINVVNLDAGTHGITINSGLGAPAAAAHATTLPGTPAEGSVVANDSSLASLNMRDTTGNAIFRAYFGQTMADFKNDRTTTVICDVSVAGSCPAGATLCAGGAACGSEVVTAVAGARTRLWVDAALQFTASNLTTSLGSAAAPVLLVTPFDVTFDATQTMYGMLYGASPSWQFLGSGPANVVGALVTRANFVNAGNLSLSFDPGVLAGLQTGVGSMVRVPGSWRDFN